MGRFICSENLSEENKQKEKKKYKWKIMFNAYAILKKRLHRRINIKEIKGDKERWRWKFSKKVLRRREKSK